MEWRWPAFSATKDTVAPPRFRSFLLRFLWRFYAERFSQAGRWFFWTTVIFTIYGLASLDIQAYVPFVYAVALWITAFVGLWVYRPRVALRVEHADRVCAGETLPITVELHQLGRPAGELYVLPHRLPPAVDAVPELGVNVPRAEPGEKVRASLGLRCPNRGVYVLRGFRVETPYPFGMLHARRVFWEERRLVVYPQFHALTRLEIPSGRRYQPGGVALASVLGDSFEYLGNREYREGDNIRDIDWRATARVGRPIVREYREEYFLRVAVVLDTHVARGRGRPAALAAFERAVSLCAAASDFMARQEYLVDIFAAGPDLYHLTAGRSLAYLDQILDILACVEASPAEPFAVLEPEIGEHLARITTVICVFLDWNESRRAFAHRLREQGTALKVIIVRDGPCTLDPAAEADRLGHVPVISEADFRRGIEEL